MKAKNSSLHFASIIVLGVFIILSTGSLDLSFLNGNWGVTSERTVDGIKTETQLLTLSDKLYVVTKTGKTDNKGRWNGLYEEIVSLIYNSGATISTGSLQVNKVNGKNHGIGIRTITTGEPTQTTIDTLCFSMGVQISDCSWFEEDRDTDTSAYCVLTNSYSDYLGKILILYNDEAFIKAYMDTLEKIINSYPIDTNNFDEYYSDALDELENTVFDSLTLDNGDLTILNLLELMRDGMFRQAVYDRYLKNMNSTFQVISEFYPEFLLTLQVNEISVSDFEDYCFVFDSLLVSFGPLDTEAFTFPDSLDERMIRAYAEINALDSSGLIKENLNNQLRITDNFLPHPIASILQLGTLGDMNSAVAILSLREFFFEADIIKNCQREAYFRKNEFIDLPTVTTFLKAQNSNTEAEIEGYVINDGGGEVTKKGILWAQHYNPTMDDNQENAGNGIDPFTVTLSSLTPSETYYARSFATNSTGTNFGNCIEFVAQQVTGTNEISIPNHEVKLFPNPAQNIIDIMWEKRVQGIDHLFISDVCGNQVLTKRGNGFPNGKLILDVTHLQEGIYLCQIKYKDGVQTVKKFTIVR